MRQSRKYDHLKYAVMLNDGPRQTCFTDFTLIHNCLPDIDASQVNMTTSVAGIQLKHPLIFNAITGGAEKVTVINQRLAEVARTTGSAMAVGSQYAGLEQPETIISYQVARNYNPDGVIFANLGAHVAPEQACAAVDMIEAQALQIHLNVAQEVTMAEGERVFSNYLKNIEAIVKKLSVPVIVKEVGCGIAAEQAAKLSEIGVKAIDVGGSGGTNFIAIEAARRERHISEELSGWGIPTAISAVEVSSVLSSSVDMVVSGGVRTPLDAVKAMVIGAAGVAVASPLIKILQHDDNNYLIQWVNNFINDMKTFMLLTGSVEFRQLRQKPVVITGYSKEWLNSRGIDTSKYAMRGKHG